MPRASRGGVLLGGKWFSRGFGAQAPHPQATQCWLLPRASLGHHYTCRYRHCPAWLLLTLLCPQAGHTMGECPACHVHNRHLICTGTSGGGQPDPLCPDETGQCSSIPPPAPFNLHLIFRDSEIAVMHTGVLCLTQLVFKKKNFFLFRLNLAA